ncbi:hypothetical protein CR205_01710 [Alteribacter lacisalsi]|uniref:Uncharacterized protein n=1 Tax=Alteribacter lacisalsi TaxID=2045244 RepID=A0A2W0HIP1_9BACI|nr:hypothetical protein CR205_01710 [Alteribacter lacisalsi]
MLDFFMPHSLITVLYHFLNNAKRLQHHLQRMFLWSPHFENEVFLLTGHVQKSKRSVTFLKK